MTGKEVEWLDYLPSPVIAAKATSYFCAVASQDGSLNVYSHTGRRLVSSPHSLLAVSNSWLGSFLLSASAPQRRSLTGTSIICLQSPLRVNCIAGMLHFSPSIHVTNFNSRNVKQQKAAFAPASVVPLLASSPNSALLSATVSPNGTSLIRVSNGVIYSYDPHLLTFIKTTEKWWAENSDAWHGRPRAPASIRGVMTSTEYSLNAGDDSRLAAVEVPRPQWWSPAITLGHLESRMHAIKLLESSAEYRQVVLLYSKKLADEGFRSKAEEFVKELFGPVYWCVWPFSLSLIDSDTTRRPGRDGAPSATICGVPRRDLLKDVLAIFGTSLFTRSFQAALTIGPA